MTERLISCARCGTTRPYSLTGMCQRCGFQGFKRLQSIEEHASWPVYQARRFHWQESLKQVKDAYRAMSLVQKELAQVCVAIGVDFADPIDNHATSDAPEEDASDILLAENGELRRKLQECTTERDKLRSAAREFSEAVAKVVT